MLPFHMYLEILARSGNESLPRTAEWSLLGYFRLPCTDFCFSSRTPLTVPHVFERLDSRCERRPTSGPVIPITAIGHTLAFRFMQPASLPKPFGCGCRSGTGFFDLLLARSRRRVSETEQQGSSCTSMISPAELRVKAGNYAMNSGTTRHVLTAVNMPEMSSIWKCIK